MSNLYRRPSIVASYQVSVFIVSSFSEIMCTDFVFIYLRVLTFPLEEYSEFGNKNIKLVFVASPLRTQH
jgi:hypothetical protein